MNDITICLGAKVLWLAPPAKIRSERHWSERKGPNRGLTQDLVSPAQLLYLALKQLQSILVAGGLRRWVRLRCGPQAPSIFWGKISQEYRYPYSCDLGFSLLADQAA